MNNIDKSIAGFWVTFLEQKANLEPLDADVEEAFVIVLQSLQQIHEELWFEYCASPGNYQLIITAQGNTDLFPIIEDVISHAPTDQEWSFTALKPKIGLPETATWENITISKDAVYYQLVENRETQELGLQLYVANLEQGDNDAAHNAVLCMIDSYLGEKRFAETITETWMTSVNEDEATKFFPLDTLEKQLDSRATNN